MAFYISRPKLLFETTEISTHPNSTQQESNYIYLYTTKFGTSIKIRLNRKFESTEFETMRVNCNKIEKNSLFIFIMFIVSTFILQQTKQYREVQRTNRLLVHNALQLLSSTNVY